MRVRAKFKDFEKECQEQRHLWHKEVDNIFDKIDVLRRSLRQKSQEFLKTHEEKTKSLICEMTKEVQENKRILKLNRFTEVRDYQPKAKKYRDGPEKVDFEMPCLNTNIDRGEKISLEIGDFKAMLTQTPHASLANDTFYLDAFQERLMDEASVIAVITTDHKPLYNIACSGEIEVWISADNITVTRMDLHGCVKEKININSFLTKLYSTMANRGVIDIFPDRPIDISATKEGDLLYNNRINKTVNVFKSGKTKALITTTVSSIPLRLAWVPLSLHCTKSGDLLVHTMEYSVLKEMHAIVRYDGQEELKVIHTHFLDGLRFIYMAENNNGDICVSLATADHMVVINEKGMVRFRYHGTNTMRNESFAPKGIVTDSQSRIIVSDYNNDCLHILDQDGQFLGFIEACGLEKPWGLSVDSLGRLWVGLCDSGKIKVVKYLKQYENYYMFKTYVL